MNQPNSLLQSDLPQCLLSHLYPRKTDLLSTPSLSQNVHLCFPPGFFSTPPIQNALILQDRARSTAPNRTNFSCLQSWKHFILAVYLVLTQARHCCHLQPRPTNMLSEPKRAVSKRDHLVCTSGADWTNEHGGRILLSADWKISGQGPKHQESLNQNQSLIFSAADIVSSTFEIIVIVSIIRKWYCTLTFNV